MDAPKAKIEVFQPFLLPSERVDALSDPPSGPFDKHCPALEWKYREYSGKKYQSALIPTHRFKDFCEGEQMRAGCSFYVQKTGQNKKQDKENPLDQSQVLCYCLSTPNYLAIVYCRKSILPDLTGQGELEPAVCENAPPADSSAMLKKVLLVAFPLPIMVSFIFWCLCIEGVSSNVQAKVKKSAVKEKVTMHCSGGPEDHISKVAVAAEVEDGKRLDRIGLGLSCRVGCGVKFGARTQPDIRHITELLYYEADHSDACKVSIQEL